MRHDQQASTTINSDWMMSNHIMLEKCQVMRPSCEPGVQPAPIGGPKNDKIVSISKYNVTNPVNKMLALNLR